MFESSARRFFSNCLTWGYLQQQNTLFRLEVQINFYPNPDGPDMISLLRVYGAYLLPTWLLFLNGIFIQVVEICLNNLIFWNDRSMISGVCVLIGSNPLCLSFSLFCTWCCFKGNWTSSFYLIEHISKIIIHDNWRKNLWRGRRSDERCWYTTGWF